MVDPASVSRHGGHLLSRRQLWILITLALLVLAVAAPPLLRLIRTHPPVWHALLGGSVAALATAVGTLPALFSRTLSDRLQDTLLGFGAGVMLAASSFSLILPGLEAAQEQGIGGGGPWAAGMVIGGSILMGAAALLMLDKLLPHEHFIKGREGLDMPAAIKLRRTWLFVIAIALHNLPEGLAIGVAYAAQDVASANALAMGIAIQDIPEGLVVAVALLAAGYKRSLAITLGMLSGLVEPVMAVLGAAIIGWSAALLPWGLGLAAGAMLFVISHEIIPESHRKGHEAAATAGLMIGFVLMMLLDTALG